MIELGKDASDLASLCPFKMLHLNTTGAHASGMEGGIILAIHRSSQARGTVTRAE